MRAVGQAAACVEGQPVKWFKHHTDARSDAKLRKVTIRYGAEGYALYWYCLEVIAGKVCAENLTFDLEHDADLIAHELRIDSAKVQEIMGFMVNLGLFEESENHTITCLKIARHLDERFARTAELKSIISSAKARELTPQKLASIIARPSEDASKTVARPSEDARKTIEGSRAEQRREESNTGRRFTPPTPTEVSEYAASAGITIAPDRFCNFYASKGWKVGKTPMKDWKAAVRNWGSSPTTQIVELAHPSQRGVIL